MYVLWMIHTETGPSLPAIGDPAILFKFWNNVDDNSSSTALDAAASKQKPDDWHDLETLGDQYIRTITHQLFPEIFGAENYVLNTLVFDHANSNPFFEALTIHYGLQQRLRQPPQDDPNVWKLRADIFEAWVGGHIYERQLYNKEDELFELKTFLHKLFSLRYRNLMKYVYNPTISQSRAFQGQLKNTKPYCIKGKDSSLRDTFGGFLDAPNVARPIGFLASGWIDSPDKGKAAYTAFSLQKSEVEKMVRLRLGTRLRNLPLSLPSLIDSVYSSEFSLKFRNT